MDSYWNSHCSLKFSPEHSRKRQYNKAIHFFLIFCKKNQMVRSSLSWGVDGTEDQTELSLVRGMAMGAPN